MVVWVERLAVLAGLWLTVAGCGGRSDLGIFDHDRPEGDVDGGTHATSDAAVSSDAAEPVDAASPMDAAPDADAGPPLPFEGPLEVLRTASLDSGELRVLTLRNATDGPGPLEIHALDEETGDFELTCTAGDATNVSRLSVPSAPGEELTAADERLLVEHSDCGRPPTCPPRELSLVDLDCQPVGEPIADAVSRAITAPGTIYVLDQAGDLRRWDVITGEHEIIASGVGSLRFDGRETFWTIQDGEVIRRNLDGEITGRAGTMVRSLWMRRGTGEVAFADADGVHIWIEGEDAPQLIEPGGCRPVYAHDVLMLLAPCDTGSLVLLDRAADERWEVADDVGATPHAQWNDHVQQVAYVVDPDATVGSGGPTASRPWRDVWVFEPDGGSTHLASQARVVRHLRMGTIGLIHDVEDGVGTFSVWNGGTELQHVADRIGHLQNGNPVHALIADYEDGVGRLLAVDPEDLSVTTVADGVPARAIRIARSGPEMVYLADMDPALDTGSLQAFSRSEGVPETLDTMVTPGFIRVSSPEPGVIYAVFDGMRSDIRFAFLEP